MSWMDFKTAQALKAQKVNEEARRQRLGSVQKGTSATSSVGYDSLSVQKAVGAPKKKAEATGRLANASDAARVETEIVRHSDPASLSVDQSCESKPEESSIRGDHAPLADEYAGGGGDGATYEQDEAYDDHHQEQQEHEHGAAIEYEEDLNAHDEGY